MVSKTVRLHTFDGITTTTFKKVSRVQGSKVGIVCLPMDWKGRPQIQLVCLFY